MEAAMQVGGKKYACRKGRNPRCAAGLVSKLTIPAEPAPRSRQNIIHPLGAGE
jgi:hypothetical protein